MAKQTTNETPPGALKRRVTLERKCSNGRSYRGRATISSWTALGQRHGRADRLNR
jgi:hypothetical protein